MTKTPRTEGRVHSADRRTPRRSAEWPTHAARNPDLRRKRVLPNGPHVENTRTRRRSPMKLTACCTITAVLAVTCCSTAEAQTRSRVDLEVGGWVVKGQPGLVMGATGWANDHSGVVARGFVVPGSTIINSRGFEILYHHRRFVGDFEIDLGTGLMYSIDQSSPVDWSPRVGRDIWSWWFWRADALVGYRLLERLGVKGGLGIRTGDSSDHIVKFMVVVPLGEQ